MDVWIKGSVWQWMSNLNMFSFEIPSNKRNALYHRLAQGGGIFAVSKDENTDARR